MEILRGLKIANREWNNIKASLEMCGDIGEIDSKNHVNSNISLLSGGPILIRNLIEMDARFPTYGYFTMEAAYVFSTLASRAAERLGLRRRLAYTFGSGYSWIRTGLFDPSGIEQQEHIIKQLFFFKIFFPLGGFFNWDFNSSVVKTKLKAVLCIFASWQDNPSSYLQDVSVYGSQLEPLWHGLSLVHGFHKKFPELRRYEINEKWKS